MSTDTTGAATGDATGTTDTTGTAAAATDTTGTERTFTQADIDRIVAGRLARFADYDELKAAKAAADDAARTETERAVAAARDEASTEVAGKFKAQLVGTEVRAQAAELGFTDPADALAQLGVGVKVGDDVVKVTDIKVADDGTPDGPAVRAALDALAKAKPYLLKSDDTASADRAGIGSTGGKPQPTPGRGRLEDYYATASTTR